MLIVTYDIDIIIIINSFNSFLLLKLENACVSVDNIQNMYDVNVFIEHNNIYYCQIFP